MVEVPCDETLPVQEARAGEPEAWDTLFKRYQLPLYAYVFELVRDEQASLDLVQETFINAVRHIGRLREDEKFGSWLFSIAHQKWIQHWRKRRPEAQVEDDEIGQLADEEAGPEAWLIRKEEEEKVMLLLNQLPVPQRSVLLLHYIEEFSIEEIADITVTAVGTVKSRLHYAKRALKKLIQDNA